MSSSARWGQESCPGCCRKEGPGLFHAQGWDRLCGWGWAPPSEDVTFRAQEERLGTDALRPPRPSRTRDGWTAGRAGLWAPPAAPAWPGPSGLTLGRGQVRPRFRPSVSRGSWSSPSPSLASVSLKAAIAALEQGMRGAPCVHGHPQLEGGQAAGSGIQATSRAP